MAESDTFDSYEVNSWEIRGPLDRLAVFVDRVVLCYWPWLLAGFAGLLLLAEFAVVVLTVVSSPGVAVFTALSVVPALLLGGWVYRVSEDQQPIKTLAITFLLGGLFAAFSVVIENPTSPVFRAVPVIGMALFYVFIVAPTEELTKWLSVRLWSYRRVTFNHVVDGAIYGAAAGLGFATIENITYVGNHVLAVGGSGHTLMASTITMAGIRALAGPGHVIYSSFAGFYLGLAKCSEENWGPIVTKGLLIAIGAHGLYDVLITLPLTGSPLVFIGFIVGFDGFFGIVLYRKLERARRCQL